LPNGIQADLLVELESILEPLDLAEIFPASQPLEVDSAAATLRFWWNTRAGIDQNFIGVERLLGRIPQAGSQGRRAALTNLRGVQIESSYFLKYLCRRVRRPGCTFNFPDPWPKKSTAKTGSSMNHFRHWQAPRSSGRRGVFANR